MPYNPGVAVNFSPIFQGLAGGAADLASAMVAKKEKDDQDKDFSARSRATEAFIKTHAPDLGWNGDQVKAMLAQGLDETPRAHYLRLSDTVSQAVTGATLKDQLQKRQQEQQVADLKLNELKRSLSQDVTNRSALRNSMNPEMAGMAASLARSDYKFGDPVTPIDNPLAAYTGAGGEDPHTLATLAPLAASMAKVRKPDPKLMDFGGGLSGIVDANGNVQLDPRLKAKPAADRVTPVKVGDRELTLAGSHLLDEKGNPVTAPKPLDPITAQALYSQYQNKLGQITEATKPGLFESRDAWEKKVSRLKQDVNMLAGQLQQPLPYPADGVLPDKPEKKETKAIMPYRHEDVKAELKRRGL